MKMQFTEDEKAFIYLMFEDIHKETLKHGDKRASKRAKVLQNKFAPNSLYSIVKLGDIALVSELLKKSLDVTTKYNPEAADKEIFHKNLTTIIELKNKIDERIEKAIEERNQETLEILTRRNK